MKNYGIKKNFYLYEVYEIFMLEKKNETNND